MKWSLSPAECQGCPQQSSEQGFYPQHPTDFKPKMLQAPHARAPPPSHPTIWGYIQGCSTITALNTITSAPCPTALSLLAFLSVTIPRRIPVTIVFFTALIHMRKLLHIKPSCCSSDCVQPWWALFFLQLPRSPVTPASPQTIPNQKGTR